MAVDPDAGAPTRRGVRDHDLDEPRLASAQRPLEGGGAIAERRARPAREHGGHPASVPRQQRVPERVHARVHGVEPAGPDAPGDRRRAEPEVEQLRARDDAVLPPREARQPLLDRFLPHSGHFRTRSFHTPEDRGSSVTADPRNAPIQRSASGRTRTPSALTPSMQAVSAGTDEIMLEVIGRSYGREDERASPSAVRTRAPTASRRRRRRGTAARGPT
jgi:hypothetical protein